MMPNVSPESKENMAKTLKANQRKAEDDLNRVRNELWEVWTARQWLGEGIGSTRVVIIPQLNSSAMLQ